MSLKPEQCEVEDKLYCKMEILEIRIRLLKGSRRLLKGNERLLKLKLRKGIINPRYFLMSGLEELAEVLKGYYLENSSLRKVSCEGDLIKLRDAEFHNEEEKYSELFNWIAYNFRGLDTRLYEELYDQLMSCFPNIPLWGYGPDKIPEDVPSRDTKKYRWQSKDKSKDEIKYSGCLPRFPMSIQEILENQT